jgi:excisionase family DNA binding protein
MVATHHQQPVTVPRGMRIAEAASYMGVSPWYVELKIRSKELRAYRLCRHYTIFREDLDHFLDEQKGVATATPQTNEASGAT